MNLGWRPFSLHIADQDFIFACCKKEKLGRATTL